KKAEQYNDVSTRLRSLEVDLFEREYAQYWGKLAPLEQQYALAQTDRSSIDASLRAREEHIDNLRSGLEETERRLSGAQAEVAGHSESVHRTEERTLVARERLMAVTNNIERYHREKSDLNAQHEVLIQEKIDYVKRDEELREQILASDVLLAGAREE